MEQQKSWYISQLDKVFRVSPEEIHDAHRMARILDENATNDFEMTCLYCLGIVCQPLECSECSTPYCSSCIESSKTKGSYVSSDSSDEN